MNNPEDKSGLLDRIIRFCLENKLVVSVVLIFIIVWGIMVAPFDWKISGLERQPVPVDAIPDIGENQQIVFTRWMGRSPQDVEDQISYPLTVSLLGLPGVKTIRSFSMFGFSSGFESTVRPLSPFSSFSTQQFSKVCRPISMAVIK